MAEPAQADRRDLLRRVAAVAACGWLPRGAYAQHRWSFDPFALGVASGSPTTDSVVLWTRLVAPGLWGSLGDGAIPVAWEVAHDDNFSRIAQRGQTLALPELAHSVHAEVPGLQPDRWYYYRFSSGGVLSTVGRTRTLPAPGAAVRSLRLAYASCQRWEHGYYAAWRHMREERLDLVLFLGDYIYEYPNATAAVRSFPHVGMVTTLADYRERHALHKSDANLQAMHAACPWLLTWDDHEVQNDYAGPNPGDSRPLGLNHSANFARRRADAYQAYYEHMPLRSAAYARASDGGVRLQLHTHLRFGALAELLLLDARQYRDQQACGRAERPGGLVDPAKCATWNDPARTLLGTAQEKWLDRVLAQSAVQAAPWTVLGQQGLFGQRENRTLGAGSQLWNDGWDGYPAARLRLTESLQRHQVANPVLLGGDVHENWVGHVKADYLRDDSPTLGVEFCGTSITSRSGGADLAPQRLARNPHFVFADGSRRGYGVCEFTPERVLTQLRVLDDAGRADAQVQTQARFVVEAGRRLVEKV